MNDSPGAAARILVVDDDPELGEMVATFVRRLGHEAAYTQNPGEALSMLTTQPFELVITDLHMATMDGITLCGRIAGAQPDVPVIVLTGHASLETAVGAMRAGAYDFLTKPVNTEVLQMSIARALEHGHLRREVLRLRDEVGRVKPSRALVGSSRAMRELHDLTSRVAATDATVLITGESGTGKELVARAIHGMSARAHGPFVAINCAAVPHHLLESELFGHVKGAFTDARNGRPGLFVEANGGTLLLDEIGEMPLEMQAKLLRALQERTVRPVGGDREVPFDARVIGATHQDLESLVESRRFREDLFYRIAVVIVQVPTLRERSDDVLVLAQHFLTRFVDRFGKRVVGFHPTALARMVAYSWPGNVRELENCVERAVALTRTDTITIDDLPERIRTFQPERPMATPEEATEMMTLSELERRYLQRVLSLVGGNKSRAARVLGLDRRTLYRMLDRERGAEAVGDAHEAAGERHHDS
ncbi:MAG: Response regulator of zinc sigma-54-dependent two-component system [Myxococcaceae bacterium]|nr:Response regulator of zinc sigma-54-dependent two-component system [Myxococcaceae bacterium]